MKNSQNCLTMLSLIIASSCIAAPVYAADQYGKSDIQESGTASVTEGSLTESGDKGADNLYGGYAQITGSSGGNATVTDSKADLTNVTTTGTVAGGWSQIDFGSGIGTTTGCTLTINGGTYGKTSGGAIYGRVSGGAVSLSNPGEVHAGTATGNSLEVSGNATLNCNSYGGFVESFYCNSGSGTVYGNSFSLLNSTANGTLFGGAYSCHTISDLSINVTVDKNSVTVTGSELVSVYGAYIDFGSAGTLTTNHNNITVEDSEVEGTIYGGRILIRSDGIVSSISSQDNTVEIKKSAVNGDIYGASAGGAFSVGSSIIESATASSNHVSLDDITLLARNSRVIGGFSSALVVNDDNKVATAKADKNTLYIGIYSALIFIVISIV